MKLLCCVVVVVLGSDSSAVSATLTVFKQNRLNLSKCNGSVRLYVDDGQNALAFEDLSERCNRIEWRGPDGRDLLEEGVIAEQMWFVAAGEKVWVGYKLFGSGNSSHTINVQLYRSNDFAPPSLEDSFQVLIGDLEGL